MHDAITDNELATLKAKLPRGYQRMAHKRLRGRYSYSYIGLVASGRRKNTSVLEALVQLAHEEAERMEGIRIRLQQLP
jgi:hypothetical protein